MFLGMECELRHSVRGTGLMAFSRSPKPILAKGGELLALLAGRPADGSYLEALSLLQTAMLEAKAQFSFTGWLVENQRGVFKAISAGVTLGGGSKVSFIQPDAKKS